MLQDNFISLDSVFLNYLEISTAVCVPSRVSIVNVYFIVTIFTPVGLDHKFVQH